MKFSLQTLEIKKVGGWPPTSTYIINQHMRYIEVYNGKGNYNDIIMEVLDAFCIDI